MNLEEEKKGKKQETTEQQKGEKGEVKQYKVGITAIGFEVLNKFVEKINMKSKRRIRTPEVLEFAVSKLSESDISPILERNYTAEDKIEVLLEAVNSTGPEVLSREELLLKMVESFEYQFKPKSPKPLKIQQKSAR